MFKVTSYQVISNHERKLCLRTSLNIAVAVKRILGTVEICILRTNN